MTLSFEALLVLGIVGFYLYDSAMLLYFNELVFSESYGRWAFACPEHRWRIRGKSIHLPNPLTPGRPVFRFAWSPDDQPIAAAAVEESKRIIASLRPLGYLVTALLVEMALGVPLVIFKLGTGKAFFLMLAAIYLTILATLAVVFQRRQRLGLSTRDTLFLAFDAIACPPFAINLVRKISLRRSTPLNPVEFARHQFEPEKFCRLTHAIQAKLEEEMAFEDENSARSQALKNYHAQLSGLAR